MFNRTTEILGGKLEVPAQLYTLLNENYEDVYEIIEEYFEALWHSFLNEDGVNGLYWAEKFANSGYDNLFLKVNYYLEKLLWIEMEISSGFCLIHMRKDKILKWIDNKELYNLRKQYRLNYYKMRKSTRGCADDVKIDNGIKKTGIVRKGFQRAGRCQFKYDTKYIRKYQKEITEEVTKKLIQGIKDVDYKNIVKELIAWYASNDGTYTLGKNVSDSRGRAIFECTKRVFNPIANKTARSVLVLPSPVSVSKDGWENIWIFVAELNHVKAKTWSEKCDKGYNMAMANTISDKCDLHERIWLERIYENICNYENEGWYVPISCDVTACGLAILGTLTNDHHFLDGTNIIGEQLKDIWSVDGLPRDYVKKAITPILYGSSQTPDQLWDDHDYKYTQKQINIINHELMDGRFKNVLDFKEHIIGNVKPQPKMHIKLWNDEFDIYCNKFKWDVTVPKRYNFLLANRKVKTVTKETAMIPDVNAFKTFFGTLCLHGIDSQIANFVCEVASWVIPIHDDFIVSPNEISLVRELYRSKLQELYTERHKIMKSFCESIGITDELQDVDKEELDIESFSGHCLK